MKRPKIWTVRDFAEHMGISPRSAKTLLLRLDAKHGGQIILPRQFRNAPVRCLRATLKRLEPDLFATARVLEWRVEELEEQTAKETERLRRLQSQVRYNANEIERVAQKALSQAFAEAAKLPRRPTVDEAMATLDDMAPR